MRRGSGIGGLVVAIWLVIGLVAAFQRGYFSGDRDVSCRTFADTALTIVAGPLNYIGVNPKVDCDTPKPSK
jgi:ABC-type dipeptide/oligopeptide/nickel transport system permease subunit